MTHPIIEGPTGGVAARRDPGVFRLEIRDLAQDEYQFSLFIQAMQVLLDCKTTDPLSYVGIGSIHGLPADAWGGAPPPSGSYCTHRSNLFPTWHRPYVSLLEQEVYRHAAKIARKHSKAVDGSPCRWLDAARDLRFPYWDWARRIDPGQPPVPEVLTSKTVSICFPSGDNSTVGKPVNNPLFCGFLAEKYPRDTFPFPFDEWRTTIRYATSAGVTAESDVEAFNKAFASSNPGIRTDVYCSLMLVKSWDLFSNDRQPDDPVAKANSLEEIHDTMHGIIGGITEGVPEGHMADIAVAAFDPIFFLHHANVDRLLALWQAINPDQWVPTEPSAKQPDVSTSTSQTALVPFRESQNAFWNSEGVRNYATALHYSYPEFRGLKDATPQEARVQILRKVHELYLPLSVMKDFLWTLLIVFDRDELGTSYMVEVYIKDTFAGVVDAFANKGGASCANCQNTRGVRSEGFVHLNRALLDVLPQNQGLPKREVLRMLRAHLNLRVVGQKPDGTPIDISRDLPTLKAVPFSHSFQFRGPTDVPTTGGITYHEVQAGHPWIATASVWAQQGVHCSADE